MKVEIDTENVALMRAIAEGACEAYNGAPAGCTGGSDGAIFIYAAYAVAKVLEGMPPEEAVKDAIANAEQPYAEALAATVQQFSSSRRER